MFSIKSRKHCLPTKNTVRFLPTQKMLYALLLDRMYLSARNGWVDRYGRVYQFFTIKQGQELLHFGHDKIIRLFGEFEKADLIQRNRQGQGKANIIYLKKF